MSPFLSADDVNHHHLPSPQLYKFGMICKSTYGKSKIEDIKVKIVNFINHSNSLASLKPVKQSLIADVS